MDSSNQNTTFRSTGSYGGPMRRSVHPTKVAFPMRPPPSLGFERTLLEDGKTIFEKDHAIPMRDGVKLYANLYRPIEAIAERTPTLVFFSPFGKHGGIPPELFKNMGVDFSKLSKHTHWELPDPLRWCPQFKYSMLLVDARASWWSEGDAAYYVSPEEGRDGYDIVEWVAKQSWNSGKVGWGAVSYYAMTAYQVAVLKPPHLAAIMPWEGISDLYREVHVVGGIPSTAFQYFWMKLTGNGLAWSEDASTGGMELPTFGPFWASKVVDWSKIDIPAFSITNWSSMALHLRGTIAAWKTFASKDKYLYIHAKREWEAYYDEDGVRRQKAFWDKYLRDEATEVDNWPRVEIAVRETFDKWQLRSEVHWPPQRAKLTSFYLTGDGQLGEERTVQRSSQVSYSSYKSHLHGSRVSFEYTFPSKTEITGDASVKLYLQAMDFPDADLYVAVQKIARNGEECKFYHQTQKLEGSAAHGWLRLSHREKDDAKSRPGRPYHKHERRLWVRPVDVVEAEVELWPSSTVWHEGETLRLVIQGHQLVDEEMAVASQLANRHNFGEVRVWFGGQYDSQLYLPVVA